MNTEPKLDPAASLYHGTSGHEYHDRKRALSPEALEWVMALRAEKFQRHVRPEDVVLELGVGAAWNLGRLRCSRRIGCDTSEFLAGRLAALGIEFVADISAVPDATAHVVICHHTLEHILEPAEMLRQLARILRPRGKLLLYVPARDRQYRHYRAGEADHHLYTWSAQNLGNLVSVLGYEIESVRVRRYGYDRFAANMAARFRAGEHAFRLIRHGLVALRPLLEVELIGVR